jgi:hypothetical protein
MDGRCGILLNLIGGAVVLVSGCRNSAPLHTWQPALALSATGRVVALAPLTGPRELSEPLERSLGDSVPFESHGVQLVTPESLARTSPIALASAVGMTSDLAALHAARQCDAQLLLLGEVLSKPQRLQGGRPRGGQPNTDIGSLTGSQVTTQDGRLAVAWRVLDVGTGETVAKQTVITELEAAGATYPELLYLPTDPSGKLAYASARQTWQMLAPTITKHQVRLASPLSPWRALDVQRGNVLARAGKWPEAERAWQSVADRNPWSVSARHNLALAAAAREDFASARKHAQFVVGWWPTARNQKSYIFLEQQRWQYHQAFRLPDPDDGWPLKTPDAFPSAAAPEPELGWTWWTWLTQPIPMPWN